MVRVKRASRWISIAALGVAVGSGCKKEERPQASPAAPTKKDSPSAGSEAPSAPETPGAALEGSRAALAMSAQHFVDAIRELETTRDVTCWTSFRQLDSFISSKSYSDFATLTKILAAEALVHGVWAAASKKAAGAELGPEDIEAVFSMQAELPEAKKAELEKFADDIGWQQFHDYRTTSEHWRLLLAVAEDELARTEPAVKPLTPEGADRLALAATRLSLSLLTEAGQIATEARTPLIEPQHVQQALRNLLAKHGLPEVSPPSGPLDEAGANKARIPLTASLIDAKIEALRHYNASTDDLHAELNKISKIPIDDAAVDRLVAQLEEFAAFVATGAEPMRADNYLADQSIALSMVHPVAWVDVTHVENVTQQLFPYLMMPNGDVKLRFEPRPGHVSPRDLVAQDVTLLDHQMNAVRDTALHWVVLRKAFRDRPFAMDPFAAEYLSEVVSIMATLYIRRAQTMSRQQSKPAIGAELMNRVQDVGYVLVMPGQEEASTWGPEQKAAKAKVMARQKGPRFADVTAKWGLPTTLEVAAADARPGDESFDIQAVMGAGIAVGDVDRDGMPDLFLAGEGRGKLYLNREAPGGGRRFEDVTEAWGVPPGLTDSRGPLLWDYDGDDDLDLLVLRSRSPSLLLRNEGEKLTEVAAATGLETAGGAHVATAFDYDHDGDLDLYVGYYGSAACNRGACPGRNLPSLDGRNGSPNQLFRNDGGTFVEVGAGAGVADPGWTLAVSSFDYDLDGDPDLYLANDFGANPLLRNEGGGKFTDVAQEIGAADRGSGMNVSFADVDGNGAFDVFVSNIDMFSKNIKIVFPRDESVVKLSDQILRSFQYLSGNKLYLNLPGENGGRRFDAAELQWFEPGDRGWGWAGVFFDLDLDADEDMYLANGWIPGSPAADQRNQLFVRDGDLFYQVPGGDDAPESFAGNSRSVVAFDMDRDGDLDLVANNFDQAPVLLENVAPPRGNHWLEVRLHGEGGNTRAVGAVVELTTGKTVQRRVVTCGDGYLGQQGELVHFGLGRARRGDLSIVWPDGTRQAVPGARADAITEVHPASSEAGK